ncbi:hypothetical protein DGG96_03540 [Legionella qingyii]|uniref:Uncharacterized protein n=1 Tax=Legionella qingyii TaxID=2184757 RepID=A0A317U5X8_9GAMM|nr:hypothetical protein DGG96_03540 [Legionella qingyii]
MVPLAPELNEQTHDEQNEQNLQKHARANGFFVSRVELKLQLTRFHVFAEIDVMTVFVFKLLSNSQETKQDV